MASVLEMPCDVSSKHDVSVQSEALPPIVLIVESNETALASYSAQFESAGLWVATSTSPIEAIEAVRELRPDLVVTATFEDAEFDLVAQLKAEAATNRVPVILLAGRRDRHGIAARAADICLQKPVAADVLLDCSQRLIARSREVPKGNEHPPKPAPQPMLKSREVVGREPLNTMRRCPDCRTPLEWIERGRLNGVEYDYYRWCTTGCGLYCYERRADTWIKLA